MKINCTVTSVSSNGETMSVRVEGNAPSDAEWRPSFTQDLTFAENSHARRAFYIGRKVEITVRPR